MRDCENCKHRVMKVEVGKGTPPDHFWGCECWECEFEPTKNDLGVDCVARQDVERYIEGFINEYTPREELEFINLELDGLKHIPSVTPQEPKWIPISEKLPEKNVEVLATTEWGAVTIAEMYSANDWFIHEGATNAETDEIAAWMPLPKAYSEVEDGNDD